jgi:hypothetical protein
LDEYKIQYFVRILMYNKHTVASYTAIISSILAASVLAIGFVQHVVAQGNNTSGSSSTSGYAAVPAANNYSLFLDSS